MTDKENIAENPEETVAEVTEQAQPKKKKKKLLGRIIYFLLLAVFISVFVYCAYTLVNYGIDSAENANTNSSLADAVNKIKNQNLSQGDSADDKVSNAIQDILQNNGNGSSADDDGSGILPEYREVYALNPDMVGWIKVSGTVIDYPVMQTPDRPNYYLKRDFYGKYSSWGCIYAREECDVFTPSDNVVLYGHHMKDGSMFAGLDAYRRKSYWEENQYFTFDTLYERHTYQIIAVFKTSANIGEGFAYHIFNTADSEEEFNQFMDEVHKLQMYKTGLTAEYGDMLLTLSTCEYTLDNGRFVVVAKRVS